MSESGNLRATDSLFEPASAVSWLRPMRAWPRLAWQTLQNQPAIVRIVMASIQGSAPREPGVCMLLDRDSMRGTIGGGRLEWQSLATARSLLAQPALGAHAQRIVLGGDIGQCCGGVVDLWIECYTVADLELLNLAHEAACRGPALLASSLNASGLQRRVICELGLGEEADQMLRLARDRALPRMKRTAGGGVELLERLDDDLLPVWLYGAGHVGQALARVAMDLPLRLTWIDSRPELFPMHIPDSVRLLPTNNPLSTVPMAAPGTRYIVMTHSHSLDYSLCRAILSRDDFAWAGLIGSKSKAARFRSRLARHGVAQQRIDRLVCPIGVRGIDSKWPTAIAVGIATQLLQDISGQTMHDDCINANPLALDSHCEGDCSNCPSSGVAPK